MKSLLTMMILLLVCSCVDNAPNNATNIANDSVSKNLSNTEAKLESSHKDDSINKETAKLNAEVKPQSSHNELQKWVNSANVSFKKKLATEKFDKSIKSVVIDADTLWLVDENIEGGWRDVDRFKAALRDKDVRDAIMGRAIAMLLVMADKPSKNKDDVSLSKIVKIVLAERMHLGIKFITSYGTLKGNYSPEEIAVFRDKYSQIVKRDLE